MIETLCRDILRQVLAGAIQDTLETMFFAGVLGRCECTTQRTDALHASLGFHGHLSGVFELWISKGAARAVAASFLGESSEQHVSQMRVEQVTCELLNVIGGVALSRIEPDVLFALDQPQITSWPEKSHLEAPVSCALELENGVIEISVSCEAS
jgi:hypothetical protein